MPLPPVSVVVCTRDRPLLLAGCLAALERVEYPEWELIVVESAPGDDAARRVVAAHATALLAAHAIVRVLCEERGGLDRARNLGWRSAHHEIVAFTDDDARPQPGWLRALAEAFGYGAEGEHAARSVRGERGTASRGKTDVGVDGATDADARVNGATDARVNGVTDARVDGVTGRVLAASLDTPARRCFELAGGMDKGAAPLLFRGGELAACALIEVQRVGVGANMAFRRAALERTGGFDDALDVGTPAGGAGDLDLFHRLLASGGSIRYAPLAVVHHEHRACFPALAVQHEASGRSFGVHLIRRWHTRSVPRVALARYALARWLPWMLWRIIRAAVGQHPLPPRVLLAQLKGALRSPGAYRAAYAPPPRTARAEPAAQDRVAR